MEDGRLARSMALTKGKMTVKEMGSVMRMRQSTKSCLRGRGVDLDVGDGASSCVCGGDEAEE